MVVQECTDELVNWFCWELAGEDAEETFQHFAEGLHQQF